MPGGIATGPAGGDLAGSTYPNPTLADQIITSRKVNFTVSDASVATSQTTTSTSFTDLSTVGPSVSPASGITQNQIIFVGSSTSPSGTGTYAIASVSIAGAAATDALAAYNASAETGVSRHSFASGVASGSTHTMKYRVVSGTGTFVSRRITVVCL